ncbi:hypothetical protein [Brevundimonas faecalis]|uniref:DUF2382 domain-containing protein n=1 Tax=Brevundimonas faecalis TaxID=947378 RepID=A0ABV2R9M2_9CAUL
MSDAHNDNIRREGEDSLQEQARQEAVQKAEQAEAAEGADYLTDENGVSTKIRRDRVSRGDPAELTRGVGQQQVGEQQIQPERDLETDPGSATPQPDEHPVQRRNLEEAARTVGAADREDRTPVPPSPPIANPD